MRQLFWLLLLLILVTSCSLFRKNSAAVKDDVGLVTVEDEAPQIAVVEQKPEMAQPAEQVNYSDQSTWLLGYFSLSRLKSYPHSRYFFDGYDSYIPVQDAVEKLKGTVWNGIKIKVVMGSWCPDSRKHVPHFFRVLSACGYREEDVELVGVDNTKFSPVENYSNLGIVRVPTFIFYKNNVEIGRIIENPSSSLEQDMVNILQRNE